MPTADASSTLEAQTNNGSLVRAARLICDDSPNAPRAAFEAVERTCLSGDDTRLFGGKIVLLGGDFRQIPPVARHASVQEVAHLTLQAWRPYIENAERFALTDNMQEREDPAFARFVLAIGNAEMPGETIDVDTTRITLPRAVQVVDSPEDLAAWVTESARQPRDWLHNAIICPTNDAVTARQRTRPHHAHPKGGAGGGRGGERQGAAAAKAGGGRSRRLDRLLLRSCMSEDAVFTDDPDTQNMVTKEFLHETTPSGHATPHPRAQKEHGAPDAAQPGARTWACATARGYGCSGPSNIASRCRSCRRARAVSCRASP